MGKKVVVVVTSTIACVAAAVVFYQHLTAKRRWKRASRILRRFRKQCATPVNKLLQIADAMVAEMRTGLASEGRSMLKMLVSNVHSLPTGNEEGVSYGVDIRGTKLRISRVLLGGKKARIVKQESTVMLIGSSLMVGSSEELFKFVAKELARFISTEDESFRVPNGHRKELGFTFAFPVDQDSDSSDISIEWAKGFSIKDTSGKDVVALVNEALEINGVDMRVSALVNDTVGTLARVRYFSRDTVAAVILGTGTNAAYVEPALKVPKWHGQLPLSGEMVINIEWGDFNCKQLPLTEIDVCLDAQSSNPGQKMFSKLISAKNLGEIVRRILLKIAQDTALFGDIVPLKLKIPFVLRTFDMASMHQDTSEDLDMVGEKIKEVLGIPVSTPMMRGVVIEACRLAVERSARLAGAGIVAILKKIGRHESKQRTVVAVDGRLYAHYRLYRESLQKSVEEMLGREFANNVIIKNSSDRPGIGAALLSAASSQ